MMKCWYSVSAAVLLMGCLPLQTNAQPAGATKAASAAPVRAAAVSPTPKPTFVLLHGAWAGAWQWKTVGQLLQADGYTVYRPTLTGQGERVHLANPDVDLNTHITDVVNVIRFEDLHDVILMGHSYGGMVITGVADRVPDRIKALIYVDAFLPDDGESASSAIGGTGAAARSTTAPFFNPGGWPYPADRLPPYDVPQPAKTFSQPISLKNPAAKSIPAVYILLVDPGKRPEQDAFFKFYQRAKDRGWTTWTMESDHVVSMSHPTEIVKLLERAPAAAKAATH